ncbi:TetR-like C-terminal domain-containing protein [Nocardia sp. NPDC060259]|uniref:TetR-like C-terminal domain-containing protein n=1 Tax=Nocardia sp. NPDC060259 TaxID=3347088 RepID=UPI00365AF85F
MAAENGPDAVSIGEVARLAGVHESSIYRRCGTQEHVILDALLSFSSQHLPIPDSGSVRKDLIEFARSIATYQAGPQGIALARAMAVADDDSVLASSRIEFWQSRFELARVMIDRAVARGEVPETVDAAMALEALIAPAHFRALLTHQPIDEPFLERVVDQLLQGIGRYEPRSRA